MTHIKICGITSLPDALAAVAAGADMLGFNFYAASPRHIEPEAAAPIAEAVKKDHPGIRLVGVFVNASLAEINMVMDASALDLAQLHGDEPAMFRAALGLRAFKAFRGVPDGEADEYARGGAPAFLIDAAVKGAYGGTGVQADWPGAAQLAGRYPLLLAGGLNPENVAAALRQVRPWGVDVASGVESAPGRKDAARMRAFVQAAREAS